MKKIVLLFSLVVSSIAGIAQPCLITNMTANISACNPAAGDYSTSGIVEFNAFAPAVGQLIVEDCNGNQQVFNAPFISPTAYSISGQNPDGLACDVTAFFYRKFSMYSNNSLCCSSLLVQHGLLECEHWCL